MVILLYNQINILQQFDENEGESERVELTNPFAKNVCMYEIYILYFMNVKNFKARQQYYYYHSNARE